MALFASSSKGKLGVLIDVGSGSVLASIVHSNPDKAHPDIIWAKREFVPFKRNASVADAAKGVMTSLMNAILLVESEGKKALKETPFKNAPVTDIQVTIAAPWSYTVTKQINYKKDAPFAITDALLSELIRAAQMKITEELKEHEVAHKLGLQIIARSAIDMRANGYTTHAPSGQIATTLEISYASAIAQQYLVDALNEAQQKVLPKAELSKYSFMLVYYCIIRDLFPEYTEYCLVDITFEATEIGVVRDGVLHYCTHAPVGAYTIAREVADVAGVPLTEAYGYLLSSDLETLLQGLSESQRERIQAIFESYQENISTLFHETGDVLAVPKKVILHSSLNTEPFFMKHVIKAAEKATRGTHSVDLVTSTLLQAAYDDEAKVHLKNNAIDTALLISAQFFHKRHHCYSFTE